MRRRGRGSASTPPKSRTGWSSSAWPIAGPAKKADIRTGDIVLSVAGKDVRDLAGFFRRIWAQGQAGVEVPITIYRDGETMDLRVKSSERNRFLKGPSLH